MIPPRIIGQTHIYFDENFKDFSNSATGSLIRALGHGLKIAYVDLDGEAKSFINFLENLCISYSFPKQFDRFFIETFSLKNNSILKGILPAVEFGNITNELFLKDLEKFDLVIFENASKSKLSRFNVNSYLETKNPFQEIIFTVSKKEDFIDLSEKCDLITIYEKKFDEKDLSENIKCEKPKNKDKSLLSLEIGVEKSNSLINHKELIGKNKNILNIFGDGKGKSTYIFGFIIKKFIEKQDIKLIYFDKGGNFYGERFFFSALKLWSKTSSMYGKFDFVATGLTRFDGYNFRFENLQGDFSEALEGLKLLKTTINKQSIVVADELNMAVSIGLLKSEEVISILEKAISPIIISGRTLDKNIESISQNLIEVKEVKHYFKSGQGVRKGIDF